MLYNSNVLLYDRAHDGKESLWSQMASSAVVGIQSGQPLRRLPLEVTTWGDWFARHPDTLVLSTETGYSRAYHQRAYRKYFASPQLMFPVESLDERLESKTPVLGVISANGQRAYPLNTFAHGQLERLKDQLDGQQLTIVYSPQHEALRVVQAD